MGSNDFYIRYYVGHKGKFGHEFLEFEFRPDGKYVHEVLRRFRRIFVGQKWFCEGRRQGSRKSRRLFMFRKSLFLLIFVLLLIPTFSRSVLLCVIEAFLDGIDGKKGQGEGFQKCRLE